MYVYIHMSVIYCRMRKKVFHLLNLVFRVINTCIAQGVINQLAKIYTVFEMTVRYL